MANTTSITITKTAAKKHYYHSGVSATVQTTGSIASTIDGYPLGRLSLIFVAYNASGSQVSSTMKDGSTSSLPLSSGASYTGSVSGQYNYRVLGAAYQGTSDEHLWNYINTDKLTGSASYTYGSKATPSISCNITGGYINPTVAQTFTFTSEDIDYIDEQYTIASGTLYYKLKSAGSYTSIALTSGSATLAANTFSLGNIYQFYASLTMDDSTVVTTSVVEINTNETTPTVTAVSPSNRVTYSEVPFSWDYSISTGTDQYAYDLQVSSDQVTWTDIASHVVDDATSCTATVALSNTVYWRVRGYNQQDTASAWSNVLSFVNITPPDAPTISSISGTGRITVAWNATDQIAYQVIVGDYDSGWIYSTAKSHFLNEYLANGNYTIQVRVANAQGLVSEWTTTTYQQNISAAAPTASISMMEGYNQITISAGAFDTFYILRNGTVIAQTAAGNYIDYFCNGDDEYIVRGVYSDDTFADLSLTGAYTCNKPAVIAPGGQIIYVNERLDEQPQIGSSKTKDMVAVHYLGRSKPVHHVGQMLTRTWTVTCDADIEVGQIYFYRNFRGDKAWIICSNVQSSLNWFGVHEYQYTLEETDYSEAVEYAV